ncbi:MAG: FAD-dependent oxidoreductase, partial [bacterium]
RAIREGFAEWTKWNVRLEDKSLGREVTVDPEGFKYVLDLVTLEAGVELRFHSYAQNINFDDLENPTRIQDINTLGKYGHQQFHGKVVIDCTGDADTTEWCGLDYIKGYGVTIGVRFGGLDVSKIVEEDIKTIKYGDSSFNPYGWTSIFNDNTERFYDGGHIDGIDGLDIEDATWAEITGRATAQQALKDLQSKPGYKGAYVISTGTHIGQRKTRAPFNQYHLSDLDENKDFKDSIAIAGNVMADHGYMKIPYRALLPKKIDNLIFAGRCISPVNQDVRGVRKVNFIAYEIPRLVAPSMATGEAAGIAAAMCADRDLSFSQLDVKEIQKKLEERGAVY